MTAYQPKTGQPCSCRRGIERDNCPQCEGTGQRIDFKAIRERKTNMETKRNAQHTPGPLEVKVFPMKIEVGYTEDGGQWVPIAQVLGSGTMERLANANLFSLAPEMAEALQEAGRILGDTVTDSMVAVGLDAWFYDLRAILAKLEGKGAADGR